MPRQQSRFPYRRQAWNGENRQRWMERDDQMLHEEINRLNILLNTERDKCRHETIRVNQLFNDLEQTRSQVKKQKSIKEMYINQGKVTKREIERLQRYADAVTLSTEKVASQVQSGVRQKKKKDLQKDYEELKTAYIVNQEKFSSELQTEQQKHKDVQEELDRAKSLYEQLNIKYETDVLAERQKTERFQQDLEREMKSHADQVTQNQQLIDNLRAEQESMMEQEKTSLQQRSKDTELCLNRELEQIKLLHGNLKRKYEAEVFEVKKQADIYQQQLDREIKAHAQTMTENREKFDKMEVQQKELQQKKTMEINFLKQCSAEQKKAFQKEMEGVKTKLKRQISINEKLSAQLKDRDDDGSPKRKRARREEPNQEPVSFPVFFPEPQPMKVPECFKETIPETVNEEPEPMNMTVLSQETIAETTVHEPEPMTVPQSSTKSPSIWKKTRHFLGLRKPEKWKKKKTTTNEST